MDGNAYLMPSKYRKMRENAPNVTTKSYDKLGISAIPRSAGSTSSALVRVSIRILRIGRQLGRRNSWTITLIMPSVAGVMKEADFYRGKFILE